MRVPILYSLSYPDRLKSDLPRLQLSDYKSFTFTDPETEKFRNLNLAYKSIRRGGTMPCILNAANEIAVAAFLDEKIGFPEMSDVVEYAMDNCSWSASFDLVSLQATDADAREKSLSFINKIYKKR
jgi:1-deoxy-D-xylulose-5-phosphate reductoisomerase